MRQTVGASNRQVAGAVTLFLVAACLFTIRGPIRSVTQGVHFNDFLSPYIQSKALIHGQNPYSPLVLLQFWPSSIRQPDFLRKDIATGSLLQEHGIPTAYPLPCFVVIAPVALFPWILANGMWTLLNVIAVLLVVRALAITLNFQPFDCRRLFFASAALALAPLHTGIALGNPAVASAMLGILGSVGIEPDSATSGLLTGLSICLKPQIGICFAAYQLVRGRWKAIAFGSTIVIALMLSSALYLREYQVDWFTDFRRNSEALLDTGILGDFRFRNPTRFGLLNLQVLTYQLMRRDNLTNLTSWVIVFSLLGVWLFSFYCQRDRARNEILDLSFLAVVSLLPIYHRFYDASILLLPLAWVCRSDGATRKHVRVMIGLLLSVFFLPGGSFLELLLEKGRIPAALVSNWFWNSFVMLHDIWALLLLGMVLLAAIVLEGHTPTRLPSDTSGVLTSDEGTRQRYQLIDMNSPAEFSGPL